MSTVLCSLCLSPLLYLLSSPLLSPPPRLPPSVRPSIPPYQAPTAQGGGGNGCCGVLRAARSSTGGVCVWGGGGGQLEFHMPPITAVRRKWLPMPAETSEYRQSEGLLVVSLFCATFSGFKLSVDDMARNIQRRRMRGGGTNQNAGEVKRQQRTPTH